jgi:hypothetical protein
MGDSQGRQQSVGTKLQIHPAAGALSQKFMAKLRLSSKLGLSSKLRLSF